MKSYEKALIWIVVVILVLALLWVLFGGLSPCQNCGPMGSPIPTLEWVVQSVP